MKISRSGMTCGLGALALGLGMTLLAPVTSTSASPVGSVDFFNDPQANLAASQMGQRLLADLPRLPSYAGLRIVTSGLEVQTVGAAGSDLLSLVQLDRLDYGGQPIPITFRVVSRSEQSLNALMDRMWTDREELTKSDIQLTSWGIDEATNTVEVMLASYSATRDKVLHDRYGDAITVDPRSVTASGSSRTTDTPAWYGGDVISLPGGTCTSYFSLHSTGNNLDYNATAGHCGLGAVVSNGITQGTADAVRQHWTNGGNVDVEVYQVSSNAGIVWSDPTVATRSVTSRSSGDPVGTLLCTDGEADREVCRVRIIRVGPVTYDGMSLQAQVYCESLTYAPAFTPGDSGGPVYAGNGDVQAQAFGMIIAHINGHNDEGWYTPQRYIFDAYSNLTFKPAA